MGAAAIVLLLGPELFPNQQLFICKGGIIKLKPNQILRMTQWLTLPQISEFYVFLILMFSTYLLKILRLKQIKYVSNPVKVLVHYNNTKIQFTNDMKSHWFGRFMAQFVEMSLNCQHIWDKAKSLGHFCCETKINVLNSEIFQLNMHSSYTFKLKPLVLMASPRYVRNFALKASECPVT